MDLLVVAPSADGINSAQEVLQVIQGHRVTPLAGLVDRQKLELALAGSYEAVHFLGHGTTLATQLSDGLIEAGELAGLLKRLPKLKFVVLNACESESVGVEIHNELDVPVVVMNAGIGDNAAIRFAETFYRSLREGCDLKAAVGRAKQVLERLFGQGTVPQLINGNHTPASTVREMATGLQAVRSDIGTLRDDMTEAFGHFSDRLDQVEAKVGRLDSGQGRWIVVLLALLLLAQLATMIGNLATFRLP